MTNIIEDNWFDIIKTLPLYDSISKEYLTKNYPYNDVKLYYEQRIKPSILKSATSGEISIHLGLDANTFGKNYRQLSKEFAQYITELGYEIHLLEFKDYIRIDIFWD